MEDDSVKLLRECNAGIKMGISSIDDVMDHVQNDGLRGVLKDSHDIHCRLGDDTHKVAIVVCWQGTNTPYPPHETVRKAKNPEELQSNSCYRYKVQ